MNNNTLTHHNQESFVKMVLKRKVSLEITRKDIISLQSKHNITKPIG